MLSCANTIRADVCFAAQFAFEEREEILGHRYQSADHGRARLESPRMGSCQVRRQHPGMRH